MKDSSVRKSTLKTLSEYLPALALCLVILVLVMNLWKANLRVPFEYGGDALFHGMVIKGIIDNGWYLQNNFIGAPGGSEVFYFPMADNLHFLLIKLFSLFTSDYALIFNLYFLLTFPLTLVSSLYVFRHFKISYLVAVLGSLLYTFLPYHFFRNEHHLVLAGYYIVPLMVMVIVWVFSGRLLTSGGNGPVGRWRLNLHRRRLIASIVICLLIASGGLGYYAFFGCFFLLVAGVSAALYWRSVRHLVACLILVAVVFSGFVINLLPNMIYIWRQGESRTVERGTGEAEAYGLKIAQMLLPIDGHRIPALAHLKHRYNIAAPLVNDNTCTSLGAVGSIGFLTLLGWLLFWKPPARQIGEGDDTRSLLSHLSLLTIGGVLLATVGGFSSLFALLISPQMRSYNRVSIYLSFFSLFAVVLLLEDFFRRRAHSGRSRIIFAVALGVLLVIGILDQTGKDIYFVPAYAAFGSENRSDEDFIGRIEATMPAGSMIFQLPYILFPESGPVHQMPDYEHFRAYLHSKNLRWSYGAIKDRATDQWQVASANLPATKFLEAISAAGFSGVYLDRGGYADNGSDMESKLRKLVGIESLVSPNQRMLFFDLREHNRKLVEKYGGDLESMRRVLMYPLNQEWTGGCSDLESSANLNWRWCSSEGELVLTNTLNEERKIKLEMELATGSEELANLTIAGPSIWEKLRINVKPTMYSKMLNLPPGRHVIRFGCDAEPVNVPGDRRSLVFKVMNFTLQEMK